MLLTPQKTRDFLIMAFSALLCPAQAPRNNPLSLQKSLLKHALKLLSFAWLQLFFKPDFFIIAPQAQGARGTCDCPPCCPEYPRIFYFLDGARQKNLPAALDFALASSSAGCARLIAPKDPLTPLNAPLRGACLRHIEMKEIYREKKIQIFF